MTAQENLLLSPELAYEIQRLQRKRAYENNLTLFRLEGSRVVPVSARVLYNPDGTQQ